MDMVSHLPWLQLAVLAAGGISLYFIRYLWPYRDAPGARFFIATIAAESLWAIAYGVALFVFTPELRVLFELPIWLGINFIGVFFLAFALAYTGRGNLVRSKWMGGLVGLQVLHTGIVATNPLHQLAWQNYRIDPVFGAATVSYTHEPWLFINFTGIILMVAAGAFLLMDTFFSYGPLYRTQTAAVALSPVLPGLAFTLWVFEIGISPPLNLTPLTFPIHLGFDLYAFFRRNMFERAPAARRASERAAIDDLGTSVVIIDTHDRVINLNTEAGRVLGVTPDQALGESLTNLLPEVDITMEDQTIPIITNGDRREYAISTSPLTDTRNTKVGHTIVLQDITVEKQREQRLAVLNRILRHNLRNDLNIVIGALQEAASHFEDEDRQLIMEQAKTKAEHLIDQAEKARQIETLRSTDADDAEDVGMEGFLEDIARDLRAAYPDGQVQLDIPRNLTLHANPRLLDSIFRNVIENGLEHNTSPNPRVEIRVPEHDNVEYSVVFEIEDNGPGIPDHEVAALKDGTETSLEHGSGLGLWLVSWGVTALGGEVSFMTDTTGTKILLRLPTVTANETNEAR